MNQLASTTGFTSQGHGRAKVDPGGSSRFPVIEITVFATMFP